MARNWSAYDEIVRRVVEVLRRTQQGKFLGDFLSRLVPGTEDEEDVGYGPWHRSSDQKLILRHLDIRWFSGENQTLFGDAVKIAAAECQADDPSMSLYGISVCLSALAEMIERGNLGEPASTLSDLRVVVPMLSIGERPDVSGWDAV